MNLILLSAGILPFTGLICLFLGNKRGIIPDIFRVSGPLVAALLSFLPAFQVFSGTPALEFRIPWSLFQGSLYLELDTLSAFFLIPILIISALAAVYGVGYLKGDKHKSTGSLWLSYHLLIVCMMGVVLARNVLAFLLFWEGMSLTSFLLVIFESERKESRHAGWIYLVATHIGTAFLLIFFLLMAEDPTRSLDFDAFRTAAPAVCFLLALVGFGTKAGIMPFHGWLPEAHPAAPSHVSALMSGVMIKTGIYGIVRTIFLLGPQPIWCGWVLIILGAASGVFGVLFAIAQHDIKRLLAYHSVENIGIILLGIGTGVLGLSLGIPTMACLGFAGGLLHVLNHAIFKALLFLGAGSVSHASGTRMIDRLGGLLKSMPITGASFLTGSIAISGLPPLNGFISEFLIYAASFVGLVQLKHWQILPSVLTIISLALIGGLATACFTKAFGIIFLGEPREKVIKPIHESGKAMTIPMIILSVPCILIGLFAGPVLEQMVPLIVQVTKLPPETVVSAFVVLVTIFKTIGIVLSILLLMVIALMGIHHWLRSRRRTEYTVTWDCGYAKPTPRMQYTASSFAQPITDLFGLVLRTHKEIDPPAGYFPDKGSLHTETGDTWSDAVYKPLFGWLSRLLGRLLAIQHGWIHLYLLYIVITLLVFLVWWGFT